MYIVGCLEFGSVFINLFVHLHDRRLDCRNNVIEFLDLFLYLGVGMTALCTRERDKSAINKLCAIFLVSSSSQVYNESGIKRKNNEKFRPDSENVKKPGF
jgi:hypothetical protein